jgi:hypothetical protein
MQTRGFRRRRRLDASDHPLVESEQPVPLPGL